MQKANQKLDLQQNVISVSGLTSADTELTAEKVSSLFAEGAADRVQPVYIDLATGVAEKVDDMDVFEAEQKNKCQKLGKKDNPAQLRCLPIKQKIYEVYSGGKLNRVILPIEGKGLWSTLKGFLAINQDGNTVEGLTFYSHGETPGLGGEIDNPNWKSQWPGIKAFKGGKPAITVRKGGARDRTHEVDGLSGATITSNGVHVLANFWLGDKGYGPYLAKMQKGGS
jgi:Na+-transporting NADH:ubiquinone oxidoreductase subunit C